jgi:predicted kinase
MPSQEDIEAQQELLAAHHLTLTIFSGLPGTGKTTLSRLVAAHLHLPLVPLDDIVDIIPPHMGAHAQPFWEDMMHIVLGVAKIHLTHNLSVIIDAVFMGADRTSARRLATTLGVRFCPIYTYISDEQIWRKRVEDRLATASPTDEVATWERIQIQRQDFQAWTPESALFIDGIAPIADNVTQILSYISDTQV